MVGFSHSFLNWESDFESVCCLLVEVDFQMVAMGLMAIEILGIKLCVYVCVRVRVCVCERVSVLV